MQPVGRPVRGNIRTMPPYCPDFLATDGLPDVLSVSDIRTGKDYPVPGCYDFIRDRWFFAIDLPSEKQQN